MAANLTLEAKPLAARSDRSAEDVTFDALECLTELRSEDALTGVQYRACRIEYHRCPNERCVKRLL
ncbi:MAG: hypothetical protein K1X75_07125 [Leptospirales bacterium]|nr:hypothetical protein [Leptospirales bacterium]